MKTRLAAIVLAAALLPFAASAAPTASLTIKVLGVSDKGGDLRIGLYGHDTFIVRGSKPEMSRIVPAKPGSMEVTFDGLEPGDYGVKLFQDENRNAKLDMSMMGMAAAEPYGLSNDAKPRMAGPPWDDAHFAVKPGANAIAITLR